MRFNFNRIHKMFSDNLIRVDVSYLLILKSFDIFYLVFEEGGRGKDKKRIPF